MGNNNYVENLNTPKDKASIEIRRLQSGSSLVRLSRCCLDLPSRLVRISTSGFDRDAGRDNGGIDMIGPFRINQIADEGVVDQELSLIEADKKKYNWKKIK